MAKQALGKGLGALIGRKASPSQEVKTTPAVEGSAAPAPMDATRTDTILHASLSQVVPSPLQPRKHIRQENLDELMDSIREHGVMQPLIVRKVGSTLELIAGERRWRASSALGLTSVPVRVMEATDRDVLEMALIENLQREDLNPIEEAEAYVRLAREFEMRQEDIAKRVGKNRATVANAMRLLELATPVREHVEQGRLSIGHAKVLLAVKNAEEQAHLADRILKKSLTVRATEQLVSAHNHPGQATKSGSSGAMSGTGELPAALREVCSRLREHFATQVSISHHPKKGKIEIEYYGNDDLERILEVMGVR